MIQGRQIWAETGYFQVEPGEDAETNPGRYGRAMAAWIADRLRERGNAVEDVLAEDWGWCVMLQRKPFLLWVGCGNRAERVDEWGAFVVAEPGLLSRLRGTSAARAEVQTLTGVVEEILSQVPGVKRVWSEDAPA